MIDFVPALLSFAEFLLILIAAVWTFGYTFSLTDTFNRHKIEQDIRSEMNRYNRYQQTFSVIMFDNDSFGHIAGDQVLIDVVRVVKDSIRGTDLFARWGGEEFVILCPDSPLASTILLEERIRSNIEGYRFPKIENLTISFGITEIKKEDSPESMIKCADDAL